LLYFFVVSIALSFLIFNTKICCAHNGESGNQVNILPHHLSLPKTLKEMITMEKLLQFRNSTPCKIRAKRRCATHPRSIAEKGRI